MYANVRKTRGQTKLVTCVKKRRGISQKLYETRLPMEPIMDQHINFLRWLNMISFTWIFAFIISNRIHYLRFLFAWVLVMSSRHALVNCSLNQTHAEISNWCKPDFLMITNAKVSILNNDSKLAPC